MFPISSADIVLIVCKVYTLNLVESGARLKRYFNHSGSKPKFNVCSFIRELIEHYIFLQLTPFFDRANGPIWPIFNTGLFRMPGKPSFINAV